MRPATRRGQDDARPSAGKDPRAFPENQRPSFPAAVAFVDGAFGVHPAKTRAVASVKGSAELNGCGSLRTRPCDAEKAFVRSGARFAQGQRGLRDVRAGVLSGFGTNGGGPGHAPEDGYFAKMVTRPIVATSAAAGRLPSF